MSATAFFDTTMALARRLREATGLEVHIGAPLRREMGTSCLSLTLLDIQPNAALRNGPTFRDPQWPVRPTAPAAFDLRFLITCLRQPSPDGAAPAEPGELTSLGQIVSNLHAGPVLTGAALPGQDVRLAPESYGPEEMARIRALFPGEPFGASIVYRASPVRVEADERGSILPLQSSETAGGRAGDGDA